MAKTVSFTCELPNGIHARPASHMEKFCNGFASSIQWTNTRTGVTGDAKSVLSLVGTDTLSGDECLISIEGQDEDQAFEQLQQFLGSEFIHCDQPLPEAIPDDQEQTPLPRSLAHLNPTVCRGNSVSQGVAMGRLVELAGFDFDQLNDLPDARSLEEESTALKLGLRTLQNTLENQKKRARDTEKEIVDAHLSIVMDRLFGAQLHEQVEAGHSCATAIIETAKHFCQQLQNSQSEYMRERVLDIRDVSFQLLQQVYGSGSFDQHAQLTEASICIADDLTPSQFLELNKNHLKGLVLNRGGTTSHTVILARSFNIPTLVGVDLAPLRLLVGQRVALDANVGAVVSQLDEAVTRYYQQELRVQHQLAEQQQAFIHQPGLTRDQRKMEVAANIALPIEAKPAFDGGAESIGLFRTEMLYMDREQAPDEDELYNLFCQAITAADGKTIIVRTMDIGGDKPLNYLNIQPENNPFLGYRAVRIYPEFEALFRTQLSAILRASAHGALKIMIPMISSMDEILWVKEVLGEVKQKLRAQEIPFDERIKLGIMLEVPSVIFIIDQCCEEIDFFSIGTNDLTQYLIAVDRDNKKVAKHYNSLNPAFLRALDYIVREVHRHGRWIGLCGELGAKGSVLPLLVGMELDEISMSAPSIATTKQRLARLDSRQCRLLLNQAMNCRTALEVDHLLAQFRMSQENMPMIARDCIWVDADLRSKEEVIKTMTDNLFLAGRCRYPVKLAADVWAREDVFSTGLGFGFAIPHTKSEHIEQPTISVARLAKTIRWGDEDVQFVIMLTLNKHTAGDQHMKIFSKLARRIMHAEFRDALFKAVDSEAIEQLLRQELVME
ncbi:phosphoenolpyruvate--protein phosphotransferase [Celerinatantimonas sp. YJH-8]|uniref:phosphoenolpyruvate--protein phosphotransferase n=1 Tax=Celerinatantimonas sp. YJH-8 TaxID=3228714 RepID=UPI0038CA634F